MFDFLFKNKKKKLNRITGYQRRMLDDIALSLLCEREKSFLLRKPNDTNSFTELYYRQLDALSLLADFIQLEFMFDDTRIGFYDRRTQTLEHSVTVSGLSDKWRKGDITNECLVKMSQLRSTKQGQNNTISEQQVTPDSKLQSAAQENETATSNQESKDK